jgi:uncharacterized UBP type Zn finger protein
MAACTHLDTITVLAPEGQVAGCEECLKVAGRWVHLRMCQSCGKVGCCDSSPNKHASAHFAESQHPVMRSLERGENWSYCFVDDVAFTVDAQD